MPSWINIIWSTIFALRHHTGKMLAIPLMANMATFVGNILLDVSEDGGVINEQTFHTLLQSASGIQVIILTVVMALLKLKKD